MRKVNLLDNRLGLYTPSDSIVSFTDGVGPSGYTELSPDRLANILGGFDAAYALPYLVGSAPVVAQQYEDETVAYVAYEMWQLIALLAFLWILGIVGELFVPALPHQVPRREFGAYSWLALFQSKELRFEATGDVDKMMRLDELEEKFSDKRVEFVV